MGSLKHFYVVFSIQFVLAGVGRGLPYINGDVKRLDTEKFLSCVTGAWEQRTYKENDHFPLNENLNRTRRDVEPDDTSAQIRDVLTMIRNGRKTEQKSAISVFPRECGVITVTVEDGGSTIEQTPWLVVLAYTDTKTFRSSGTIISEKYVLTTAANEHHTKRPETALYILAGDASLLEKGREYNITRVTIHPDFNFAGYLNDIALIEISGKFTFSNDIQPICMPYHELYKINREVVFTGWFAQVLWSYTAGLYRSLNNIIGKAECSKMYNGISNITDGKFCSTDRSNRTRMFGHQGGPLFVNEGVHHYLLGVYSWHGKTSEPGVSPMVHTKVISYMGWIKDVMTGLQSEN